MDICLEAAIRLLFEILRFGWEHLLFIIILGLLLMFRSTGLWIIAGLGVLVQISSWFSGIPIIGKLIFLIGGATAILRVAWIYAMMVIVSKANPFVKAVSIIPIALFGASLEALLNLIGIVGIPVGPFITMGLAWLLLSKRLSNIVLSAIAGIFAFLIVISPFETICNTLNQTLVFLKEVRQEGILEVTGISRFI